ncbi:MAG TPA: DUF2188 domain-containing protein [Anaerolineae bacterium]|nr:DUF2188 domain-containing protein [Anaerolineae bacterium]
MTEQSNVWVVQQGDEWAVTRERSDRASRVFPRKQDAEDFARSMARRDRVELIVQKKGGKIHKRESYGRDPFPPRDTEH